jgi:hypothetical protein
MAQQKRSSGRQTGGPGCLFWLLLLCVVLLLFLVNLGRIRETLSRTNFNEIVRTQKGTDEKKLPPVAPAPKVIEEPSSPPSSAPSASPPPAQPAPAPVPAVNDTRSQGSGTPAPAVPGAAAIGPSGGKNTNPPSTAGGSPAAGATSTAGATSAPARGPQGSAPPPAVAKRRPATLYLVRIDDDGTIVRQEVNRQIPASDQPLTDAINALLSGPTEDELRRHLLSLVPQGTRLLSAQVRGSTAYLNFNEAFMYNHYGIEGYAGQLKQVVYTATAFPSVQDVQILIEGEKHDYLGGEGVYIGRPLSRNSF